MAAARAQKSIHPAKYFHFARLVCFGVKLKYIIDSASAAKQLEIHIDMKKRRKIECKNLYFHSITRRKNQHHTRHLLKLRNHESWLHSSNTLLPSFKLHLHLTPRWKAFSLSLLAKRKARAERWIFDCARCVYRAVFLFSFSKEAKSTRSAEGLRKYKIVDTSNCYDTPMSHKINSKQQHSRSKQFWMGRESCSSPHNSIICLQLEVSKGFVQLASQWTRNWSLTNICKSFFKLCVGDSGGRSERTLINSNLARNLWMWFPEWSPGWREMRKLSIYIMFS